MADTDNGLGEREMDMETQKRSVQKQDIDLPNRLGEGTCKQFSLLFFGMMSAIVVPQRWTLLASHKNEHGRSYRTSS
jgi:hypothetical protein